MLRRLRGGLAFGLVFFVVWHGYGQPSKTATEDSYPKMIIEKTLPLVVKSDSSLRGSPALQADSTIDRQTVNAEHEVGRVKESVAEELKEQDASFENGEWHTSRPKEPGSGDVQLEAFSTMGRDLEEAISGMTKAVNPERALQPTRIFSDRALQQLYDSLGISKMDTLMALLKLRKNVSQDELLKSVNNSFSELLGNAGAADQDLTVPTDLSQITLPDDIVSQLPPMAGYLLPSSIDHFMDSLKHAVCEKVRRDQLRQSCRQALDSLNARDSMRIAQKVRTYHQNLDSLLTLDRASLEGQARTKGRGFLDSLKFVALGEGLSDSLMQPDPRQLADSIQNFGRLEAEQSLRSHYQYLLDSIDNVDFPASKKLSKHYRNAYDSIKLGVSKIEKLRRKDSSISDDVKQIVFREKPSFWQRINFEGVFGVLQNGDSATILQFSPAIEFAFGKRLSFGAGPNLMLSMNDRAMMFSGGYRFLGKCYVFNQRAYAHVEDAVEPQRLSLEHFAKSKHSVLVGGGYLLKLSPSVAINVMMLYRVNNQSYSQGVASPFVFRIGLSSIKSVHDE